MIYLRTMDIPVKFKYEGKEYSGSFSEVTGAAGDSSMWHLTVNKHHWGRLRRVNENWYFDESKWPIGHLVDYFAAVVIAWYQ